MRKVSTGTIQRRRDGMMIDTGEASVYIPMGHDGWCPPAGTHMRVILEPMVPGEPFVFTTESGHELSSLAADAVRAVGEFALPPEAMQELIDFLRDYLMQRRGDDDSPRKEGL